MIEGLAPAKSQGHTMRKSLLFSLIALGLFRSPCLAQVSEATNGWGADFYCQTFGPGLPFASSKARRDKGTVFTVFLAEQKPVDEEAQDPLVPEQPPEMQPEPDAPKHAAFPATMPSAIAERSVGIAILIAGAAGWGLLTIAFLVLVSRQAPASKS